MNTNEQAPECCPFCGAKKRGFAGKTTLYECNSFVSGYKPYSKQSAMCEQSVATAERERLTRERDEAREERDDSREAFGNMKRSYEQSVSANINALNQIGDLCMENANLLARVKQLESDWSGWEPLQKEWFGDNYAAMQPLEAVRARIEDAEARVKRLEEAGDAIVDHNIGCGCGQDGPCRACRMACEAWNKAKEATP